MSNPTNTSRATSTTHLIPHLAHTEIKHGNQSDVASVHLISRLNSSYSISDLKSGLGRDYWLDDASATKCRDCDRKFTTFLRKHHCRICGKIFCHNCTRFIDGDKFNHKGKMRVCFFCANKLEHYENYNSSDEELDESVVYNHPSPANSNSNSSFHGTSTPIRSLADRSMLNNRLELEIPKLHNAKIRQVNNGKSPLIKGIHEICSTSSTDSDSDDDTTQIADKDDEGEDEQQQGMITLMNNHEFSWPTTDPDFIKKFSTFNGVNNSQNGIFEPNLNPHKDRLTLHRLQSKPMSFNLPSRRRNFSSRYTKPNRVGSINTNLASNFKMIQINSDIHFMDELQKASENYNKILLKELLNDKQIQEVDLWTQILFKALKKINNVDIELNRSGDDGNSYDFADYIKFKKIEGGRFSDISTIEGLVFSKKLPLKSMPLAIDNPKIMIITFAIEYDQNINGEPHFQSLDGVIAQQDEYLKKLSDRIIQLKPSIVISSCSINGLALSLLAKQNISAAPNCKLSNIIKLSKFTNATIITSIDMLARNPKLGKCEKFEQRYYVYENLLKSYFFFTGCNPKVGLTMLLRGTDLDTLDKVKACMTPMVYAFVNTDLESSFLRDKYLKLDEKGNTELEPKITAPLYTIKLDDFDDIVKLANERLISTSPWVKFHEPLIVVQIKNTIKKLDELKSNYKEFTNDGKKWNHKEDYQYKFQLTSLDIDSESDLIKIVEEMKVYQDNFWSSELAFYYRKWAQFWTFRDYTYFDPNYNQNIAVLFSVVSSQNYTPCLGPKLQIIDFYWENDESIGQYIERNCLQSNHICLNGCGLPLRNHYKSYVHHDGKIDVIIELNNSEGVKSNSIATWSECKRCNKSTNQMPLSDASSKYSFGKFLQLVFWYDKSSLKLSTVNCECTDYDFFKDFTHYFSYGEFIVKFEYSKIDSLQLITPKFKLFWDPKYDFKIKTDYYNHVRNKSNDFFDSVESRLVMIKLDETYVDDDHLKRGEEKLSELKITLKNHRDVIKNLIQNVYENSGINEHLRLNIVLREVQELSSFWKLEFDDFEINFLPTVKEMKSNFQLERLLNVLVNKDNENDKMKEKDDLEVPPDNNAVDKKFDDKEVKPIKKKSDLILHRINELNETLDESKSNETMKYSGLDGLDVGQVKRLKKLFESDTQDFFKEREIMERQKLKSANNYLPKVGTMNPHVEIYNYSKDVPNVETRTQSNVFNSEDSDFEINNSNSDVKDVTERREKYKDEKNWFFKIMNNFIDTRTSTSWPDLSYPLGSLEHIFVDSNVIVREDEPSSIISFCLSTKDYESKLYTNQQESNNEILNSNEEGGDQEKDDSYLKSILLKSGFHLNYQFEGGNSSSLIMCRIFFAEQFDALRRKCGVNDNFIESISRCIKWDSTGGKSGAAFLKTLDDRFIIKELSKSEMEAFTQMAHNYFEYFEQVLFNGLPSVLVKIFGIFQIQVKSSFKSYTMDVVIMENLFYNRKPDRIFDLKGSMRNRHVEQTGKANEVLLDENMVEYIYESPVFVKENDKKLLRASLWNDTLFLEKMNVMDYSLVVGIDSNNKELVVGIIDCIRTFTWDKKLESWVKEKGLVGGSGVGREPTVITPKQYKNRFREAMERYILLAPGAYYQGTKSGE